MSNFSDLGSPPTIQPPIAPLRPWPRAVIGWVRRLLRKPGVYWKSLDALGRWELAAYLLLLAVALGMRLWDLGGRTLHYDELLHAWYSWLYAEGRGFVHTPIMHGPFLFNTNAALYVLFGSSDTVARLLPALFGTVLVGLPYLLRRELGRPGALVAAVLLAVSPNLLYFSRFIRNDIYMAVWVLGLVIVMWRFMERPRLRLLFAWVGLWAFAFATKETAYIVAAILGLALLLMALPDLARWAKDRLPLANLPPAGALLLVLVTVTLPLWAPALGLFQDLLGLVLVNPDPNDLVADATRADAPTGSPINAGLYVAVFVVAALATLSVAVGMLWHRRRWPLLFLAFGAVWLPLYTSIFTNWQGFFTGLWGSLGYWIAQQPVERASQPWYYYLITMANYEFLAVVPALVAVPFVVRRGTLFDRFLLYWAVASLIAYTLAGEKMPWLVVNITVPFALLSGRVLGLLMSWAPWRKFDFRRTPVALALAGVLVAMLGMTVFVAGRATYSYAGFQRPNELLVYAQTGQETTWAAQKIERIAAASGKGKQGLRVLVDETDSMSWQWRWYLRDYPLVTYRFLDDAALAEPLQADVVLLSKVTQERHGGTLAGFSPADELHQLWWFPNTVYAHLSPGTVLRAMATTAGWRGARDYFFLRQLDTPMYSANGVMYVADAYASIK